MKRLGLLLFLSCAAPLALGAQTPADTGAGAHHRPGRMGREDFRKHMEEHLKTALGLTDDQAAKFKATEQRFGEQRRALMERNHKATEALRAQLRPGIAANADSVRKLLDMSEQNEQAMTQLRHDESRELAGYLSPVQRAQLQLMRERFHERRFARGMMEHHGHRGWGAPGNTPAERS